ncbi:unnamed protein product [Closterium sp. NIES-54]
MGEKIPQKSVGAGGNPSRAETSFAEQERRRRAAAEPAPFAVQAELNFERDWRDYAEKTGSKNGPGGAAKNCAEIASPSSGASVECARVVTPPATGGTGTGIASGFDLNEPPTQQEDELAPTSADAAAPTSAADAAACLGLRRPGESTESPLAMEAVFAGSFNEPRGVVLATSPPESPAVADTTAVEGRQLSLSQKKLSWKDFAIFENGGVWAGNSGVSGGGGGLSGGSCDVRNADVSNGRCQEIASMSWKSDSRATAQFGNPNSFAAEGSADHDRRMADSAGILKSPKLLMNSWGMGSCATMGSRDNCYEVSKPSGDLAGRSGVGNLGTGWQRGDCNAAGFSETLGYHFAAPRRSTTFHSAPPENNGIRATGSYSFLEPRSVLCKHNLGGVAVANVGRQFSEPLFGNKRQHLSHTIDYSLSLSNGGYQFASHGQTHSEMTFATNRSDGSRLSDRSNLRNTLLQKMALTRTPSGFTQAPEQPHGPGGGEMRSWGVTSGAKRSYSIMGIRQTASGSEWRNPEEQQQLEGRSMESPTASADKRWFPQSASQPAGDFDKRGTRNNPQFRHSFDSFNSKFDTLDADLIEIRRRAIMSLPPIGKRHVRPEGYACSFCGLNFATSQALGGHMTCHLRRRKQSLPDKAAAAGDTTGDGETALRKVKRNPAAAEAAPAAGAAAGAGGAVGGTRTAPAEEAATAGRSAGDTAVAACDTGRFAPPRTGILSGFSRYTHAIAGIDLLDSTPLDSHHKIHSSLVTPQSRLFPSTQTAGNAASIAAAGAANNAPAFTEAPKKVEGEGAKWQQQLEAIQAALSDWRENGNKH